MDAYLISPMLATTYAEPPPAAWSLFFMPFPSPASIPNASPWLACGEIRQHRGQRQA